LRRPTGTLYAERDDARNLRAAALREKPRWGWSRKETPMKKERTPKKSKTKLPVRRESVLRLDPSSLEPVVAAGGCATHYCRSGFSCLCSSG
jgi:hypothetical protein